MDVIIRFLIAFLLFGLLTGWLTRKVDPSINSHLVFITFAVKVLFGCIYGYLFLKIYNGDDTWMINNDSLQEMEKLQSHPGMFFEDLNPVRIIRELGLSAGLEHFRMKLELALMIKPLALFDLFSKGNYYINVIAFSAVTYWGHFWLYRVVREVWAEAGNWAWLVIFFYPPTLFWLTGIRGDGLLFFFFSGLLLQFQRWISNGKTRSLLLAIICWTGMLISRSAFAIILVPVLVSWWITQRYRLPVFKTFSIIHLVAILIFFGSVFLPPPLNLPEATVNKQSGYFKLEGSRVPLDSLHANPLSFLKILPQALDNTMLRPYPAQANGMLQILAFAQNIFIICLIFLVFTRRFPGKSYLERQPLFMALLFFIAGAYLSIGYTIPFPGALVRYRAIPELCLLVILMLAAGGKELTHYKLFNVYKITIK
jgi:hypothetical protein